MSNNRLAVMYGYQILDEGFTQIPNLIIKGMPKVGVKNGEFQFIINLLTFKHDTSNPFPSHETLAENCGVHVTQIKRWVKSLKEKGLLWVGRRRDTSSKTWGTCVYNVKPLIDKINEVMGKEMDAPTDLGYEVEWEHEQDPQTQNVSMAQIQNVSMGQIQNVSMGQTQIVSTKKKREKEKDKKKSEKSAAVAAGIPSSFSKPFKDQKKKPSKTQDIDAVNRTYKQAAEKKADKDIMPLNRARIDIKGMSSLIHGEALKNYIMNLNLEEVDREILLCEFSDQIA